MPLCPDCSHYSLDFGSGRCDPVDGTWYCAGCWSRFAREERRERLKLGQLLPEDRQLWYSVGSVLTTQTEPPVLGGWCTEGPLVLEIDDKGFRVELPEEYLLCGNRLYIFGEVCVGRGGLVCARKHRGINPRRHTNAPSPTKQTGRATRTLPLPLLT